MFSSDYTNNRTSLLDIPNLHNSYILLTNQTRFTQPMSMRINKPEGRSGLTRVDLLLHVVTLDSVQSGFKRVKGEFPIYWIYIYIVYIYNAKCIDACST